MIFIRKRKPRKQTKCSYCGKTFLKKANAQKYCSDTCKHNAYLENHAKAQRNYIKRWGRHDKGGTYIKNGDTIVNVSLGSTRHEDFKTEYETIQKTHKLLGLDKNKRSRAYYDNLRQDMDCLGIS